MLTICLLILAYSILGKPVGKLIKRLKEADWKSVASTSWKLIRSFGSRAGRAACRPLLYFYYVMSDENTSVTDKALIYGAILYIASPFDLLPRKVLGMFGILDDAAVLAFVYKKINSKVTPEMEASVNATLNGWFGNSLATI